MALLPAGQTSNSIFTDNLGYSYDLADTVSFYKLYVDLMQLWEIKYDGAIYKLNYENLTADQKIETKGLIKYLNLEWED